MKKVISFFLSVLLILSLSVVSFADWDSGEYDWASAEAKIKESFGDFNIYSIPEVTASLWLPGSFLPAERTAEEIENDCIASYMTGPEDAFATFYYMDSDGVSLDALYNTQLQNGGKKSQRQRYSCCCPKRL